MKQEDEEKPFWFKDPNAGEQYNGKKIRYPAPWGEWRVGTIQVRDRTDYDDKICVTIHETFYPSPYVGQVFDWRLTQEIYNTIIKWDKPDADFELPA